MCKSFERMINNNSCF